MIVFRYVPAICTNDYIIDWVSSYTLLCIFFLPGWNWNLVKVNLSLADLTMSLFNCIFNFTFMLNKYKLTLSSNSKFGILLLIVLNLLPYCVE